MSVGLASWPQTTNNKGGDLDPLALKLGLTAGLYEFVFKHVMLWLPLPIPWWLRLPLFMVVSWLAAANLARRLESGDQPADWVAQANVAAAAAFLVLQMVSFRYYRLLSLENWMLFATLVLTVRYFRSSAMLFIGVVAFALQLGLIRLAGGLFGLIGMPGWIQYGLSLGLALYLAAWLCLKPEPAADRIENTNALWFFGAGGAATMALDVDAIHFRSWVESLIWLAWLGSFVLLVRSVGEKEERPVGTGNASVALLVTVSAAIYLTVASVFKVQEIIIMRLPLSMSGWQVWLPLVLCVTVTVLMVRGLEIPQRLNEGAPGRALLLWGTVLLGIGVLAGGSIFGSSNPEAQGYGFIGALVAVAFIVGPIIAVAQLLLGVGLIRQLFRMHPPPRD